jgi:hypothetical protein
VINGFVDKIRKITSQSISRPSKCDLLAEGEFLQFPEQRIKKLNSVSAVKRLECEMPEPLKKAIRPANKRESKEEQKARKRYNNSELRRFEKAALIAIVSQKRRPADHGADGQPGGSKTTKERKWATAPFYRDSYLGLTKQQSSITTRIKTLYDQDNGCDVASADINKSFRASCEHYRQILCTTRIDGDRPEVGKHGTSVNIQPSSLIYKLSSFLYPDVASTTLSRLPKSLSLIDQLFVS